MTTPGKTLVIACGALARELTALVRINQLAHLTITCLPAIWHNYPQKIAPAVRAKIRAARGKYDHILCLYGDCGTRGALDAVLVEEGVERIAGPHCYAFFAGAPDFDAMMEAEPGTFFLTDYLLRHFDRLVVKGLGLDRFPHLRDDYFKNYRRVVYLAQTSDAALQTRAENAASRLGLAFETRFTGYGGMAAFLSSGMQSSQAGALRQTHP